MTELVTFDQAPTYLQANDDDFGMFQNISAGVTHPNLSFRGKVWRLRKDGEETELMENGNPVMKLDAVIVAGRNFTSKRYYGDGGYQPGKASAPICASRNGFNPEPAEDHQPQASNCEVCPHNEWGSNGGKGKACMDYRRVLVALWNGEDFDRDGGEIMLCRMDVPPASLKHFKKFGSLCNHKKVKTFALVTTLSLDPKAETPILNFEPKGYLPEALFKELEELRCQDDVLKEVAVPPRTQAAQITSNHTAETKPSEQPAPVEAAPPSPSETVSTTDDTQGALGGLDW